MHLERSYELRVHQMMLGQVPHCGSIFVKSINLPIPTLGNNDSTTHNGLDLDTLYYKSNDIH